MNRIPGPPDRFFYFFKELYNLILTDPKKLSNEYFFQKISVIASPPAGEAGSSTTKPASPSLGGQSRDCQAPLLRGEVAHNDGK